MNLMLCTALCTAISNSPNNYITGIIILIDKKQTKFYRTYAVCLCSIVWKFKIQNGVKISHRKNV